MQQYDIFISYRRVDEYGNISGRDQARLIAKELNLKGYNAFFDYSEIKDNEFEQTIIPSIKKCKVFIIVLTKNSLVRCKNTDDWVRKEIETALDSGCKIINVTPDRTFNGWPDSLPDTLSKIKKIQISDIDFGTLFEVSVMKLIQDRIQPALCDEQSEDDDLSEEFSNLLQTEMEDLDYIDSFDEIGEQQSADELYDKGYAAYYGIDRERDVFVAVKFFKKASELGQIEAQKFLSKCYSLGIGTDMNDDMAMFWMSKAASQNDIYALNELGKFCDKNEYYEGSFEVYSTIFNVFYEEIAVQGVDNSIMEKERLRYENSVQGYVVNAICRIGEMYEKGEYVQKDYMKAKEWFKKAKEFGISAPLKKLLDKIKAEANKNIADELPELLSIEEKYDLAKRYMSGTGLTVSYDKAFPLLEECSKQNNFAAMKSLAMCYSKGLGCIKDEAMAYSLYDIVAREKDDADAQYEQALMTELGRGTDKDFRKAVVLYILAANKGHKKSIEHLAVLFKFGRLTGKNDKKSEIICQAYAACFEWDYDKILYLDGFNRQELYPDVISSFKDSGFGDLLENDSIPHSKLWDSLHFSWTDRERWNVFFSKLKEKRHQQFKQLSEELNPQLFRDEYEFDEYNKGVRVIDLGLSSGTLWASQNVGVDESCNTGKLYAWAESKTKTSFNWDTYFDKRVVNHEDLMRTHFEQQKDDLIMAIQCGKSNSIDFSFIKNAGTSYITKSMDCGKNNFGEEWTVPHEKHFKELIDECTWIWIENENECGYLIEGVNGHKIFLSVTDKINKFGTYWSFTLDSHSSSKYACCLFFKNGVKEIRHAQRCLGMLVRPISIIKNNGEYILRPCGVLDTTEMHSPSFNRDDTIGHYCPLKIVHNSLK